MKGEKRVRKGLSFKDKSFFKNTSRKFVKKELIKRELNFRRLIL